MPRKLMFTRGEIIDAALSITRQKGFGAVSARALGERLGTSSRPVFSLFENMEEVQQTVLQAADEVYQDYLKEHLAGKQYPPYKASGMAYIQFAKEERELFKLLFMRDRSREKIQENKESIRPLLQLLQKNLGIGEEQAYLFHLEMWIYVHGIATMVATSYLNWDEEFVSKVLTDAYQGLSKHFIIERQGNS